MKMAQTKNAQMIHLRNILHRQVIPQQLVLGKWLRWNKTFFYNKSKMLKLGEINYMIF